MNPSVIRLGFPTEDLLSTTLQDLRAANPTVERGNLRLPEAAAAARALQLPDQSVRLVPCVQRTKCIGKKLQYKLHLLGHK